MSVTRGQQVYHTLKCCTQSHCHTVASGIHVYIEGEWWLSGLERWTGDRVVLGSNPTVAGVDLKQNFW